MQIHHGVDESHGKILSLPHQHTACMNFGRPQLGAAVPSILSNPFVYGRSDEELNEAPFLRGRAFISYEEARPRSTVQIDVLAIIHKEVKVNKQCH